MQSAIPDGYTWEQIHGGLSGMPVYKLLHADKPTRYLKTCPTSGVMETLEREKVVLEWLHGKLPVPEMLYFAEHEGNHLMLISEIPGLVAHHESFTGQIEQVMALLAAGARQMHTLPIADCPLDRRLDVTISIAEKNTYSGYIDESDYDDERQGRTAPDLLAELKATRPASEDLVFTHGDYCLPNVLIDPDRMTVTGFIDLGRAGIADRYQDLALCARSIAHNWGPGWVPAFYTAYGLDEVDMQKVAYYQLLDEFF